MRTSAAYVTVAVVVLIVAVVGYLWVSGLGGSTRSATGSSTPARAARVRRSSGGAGSGEVAASRGAQRAHLVAGLRRGVEAAAALGGVAEAAVMLEGWRVPAVVTSEAEGSSRFMRLWSMSKVATMIAVLRGLGWGRRPGRPIPAQLDAAFHGAITRSENCRQRRVVLELQRLAGGTAGARAAFQEVFTDAGAQVEVATQVAPPESECVAYLEQQTDLAEPLAPALLLGTSKWRVGDAVRLVHALSRDAYGAAISHEVLGLMRLPKLPSREVAPGELTAPLDWGAGESLPKGTAYKAGWGGSLNGNFLAGQIALAELPGIGRVSLAAMFHPDRQPSRDDPGITAAPKALDDIFSSIDG